jgi:hypothetical protein
MTPGWIRSGRRLAYVIAGSAGLVAPAAAWEKTYVVSWYEPAFYYDPDDKTATGGEAPGMDCAKGFSPYPDYRNLLRTSYRTQKEVDHFLDPQRRSEPGFNRRTYGIRGPKGEDVYKAPWTVSDVPYPHPTSKLAEGFNLDGDERTGYTSPEGVKGVDNAFYTVGGCVGYWRGPAKGSDGFKYSNEDMHNGDYTILIRLSGDSDPANDPNAKLTFMMSDDKLVRDAVGGIAADYTFRILEGEKAQGSTIDVRIANGVVEAVRPQTIVLKDWKHRHPLKLDLGQVRFKLENNGDLNGIVGGYRFWEDHYRGFAAAIPEYIMKLNIPAYWYALQREADGMPDPNTGKKTGVSSVYRISAVPAFVVKASDLKTAKLTKGVAEQAN